MLTNIIDYTDNTILPTFIKDLEENAKELYLEFYNDLESFYTEAENRYRRANITTQGKLKIIETLEIRAELLWDKDCLENEDYFKIREWIMSQ
jgi:hypothetical protein